MSYPGDQQQPGGWGSPRPPQSPYGPVEDQARHDGPPYGGGPHDDPYGEHDEGFANGSPTPGGPGGPGGSGGPGGPGGASGPGGAGGSGGHGGPGKPFGTDRPDPYGGGFERGQSFGAESPDPYAEGPGGHAEGPGGYGEGPGGFGEGPGAYREGPGPYGEGPGGYGEGFGAYGEGPGTYGAGPGGYGPPGGRGGGPRSGPDRKRLVIVAAVIAGVLVIGGGVAFALTSGGGEDPAPAAATKTAAPTPTASPTPTATETGRGERLQSRATDPRPLTLNEIFKARTFKAAGRKYYMTGRRSERKCAPPTHGVKFRKALAKGGCTQVLRATFSNGKFIGTIGVLNLRSQTASEAAQVASRQKDAFILALPGVGTTKKIGQGLSLTTTEVDGHYLIMSWVQYPDGKQISKKDYAAVTSFVRSTTYGSSLRTALNYRSMVGKPS